MHQNKNQNEHQPVLLQAVLDYLSPQTGESLLDLTAGYGGHAQAIFGRTGNYADSLLVDRDANAVQRLKQIFAQQSVDISQTDFLSASQALVDSGRSFKLILADLGVSSPHLKEAQRGFSVKQVGPLDMRMDNRQTLTAETIVNTYSVGQIANILRGYGEEPKAKAIAQAIVAERPLKTTDQLAAIAARSWPGHSRMHPATRSFQAIRIAVNDELGQLKQSLPLWVKLLAPGGRLAIISFHSLEDRIVKRALQAVSGDRYDAELQLLTKKPVTAKPHEIVHNPRARSAKLRAAVKINK